MSAEALQIYFVTLNCGLALINNHVFAADIFKPYREHALQDLPDVVVFSLQEVAPMHYCFLGTSYIAPYVDRLLQAVRDAAPDVYLHFASRFAGMTGVVVLVKSQIYGRFSLMGEADVGVGLWEMGNKGAAGIRVGYSLNDEDNQIGLTFVAAHLAPHEMDVSRRNRDWENIVRRLAFISPSKKVVASSQAESEAESLLQRSNAESTSVSGMFAPRSVIFFGGDLNYRTSDKRPEKDSYHSFPQPKDDVDDKHHYSHLLRADQLEREKEAGRTLHQLAEAPVRFPPTYKYELEFYRNATADMRGSEVEPSIWHWATHRNPSWCDRILFSSMLEDSAALEILAYTALPIQLTTDHRPVALAMRLNLEKALNASMKQISEVEPPFPLDPHAQALRAAARTREFIAGVFAYLGMTWEGNAVLLASAVGVLSGWLILRSF